MQFTTRPELTGTFGMATSTHWLASASGMKMLEAGGNAFDAAVAMGFVLTVVEPHLCGPMGEVPAIFMPADADQPIVLCGQGVAPAGATIEHYRSEGLSIIPGSGLLSTVIPGAFDAWMMLLHDYGTMHLRDVLEPAIFYAEHGHSILPMAAARIDGLAEFFKTEWPTSAEVWLPGGIAPKGGEIFRNPQLASFWSRLVRESETANTREAQIEKVRGIFREGFVAEAIDDFLHDNAVMDAEGGRRKGVLTGQDMADWRASYEDPLSVRYHGWDVYKCGPWSQGPSFLQMLRLLEGKDIAAMDPNGADFAHVLTEAMKLAFADREAFYGDPLHSDVPMEYLLSDAYTSERQALISATASLDQRPGMVPGFEAQARAFIERASRAIAAEGGAGAGEPTMGHLTEKKGDTVHIDVVDRWGNAVSATPSGGWLQSNPVVPGLGVPLNSRAQMFWMEEGLPTSLAPGRRPRTTLTPGFAIGPDGTRMAFGTPGGDGQEQWQLPFFLRHVHHGLNLQAAIDGPLFLTSHMQNSFYPREVKPGHLLIEPAFGDAVADDLRARGHRLEIAAPWSIGRLTAASHSPDGVLRAAATPRLMQAYAAGR